MKIHTIILMYIHFPKIAAKGINYFAVLNGRADDSSLLNNVTNIDNLPSCAKRCEKKSCMSFMYNSDSKVCSTFTSGLSYPPVTLHTGMKYFEKGDEVVNCAPINVYGKWAKCNVFNHKRWTCYLTEACCRDAEQAPPGHIILTSGKPDVILTKQLQDEVVQRRYDGTLTFDKSWDEFKAGFGDLDGEYWIGNEALHRLTHERNQTAMFVLEDLGGVQKYAQYDNFRLSSEEDKYRLTATGYSGTAGDCLRHHHGQQFSTKDNDNDMIVTSCSQEYNNTGFWYKACLSCNINGRYLKQNIHTPNAVVWITFSGGFWPLKKTRMMLRPSP